MSLAVIGLIFDIFGVCILTFTAMISPRHGRREDVKWWSKKRYWWNGWRPIYRNTKTGKLFIKWNHRPVVEGQIPPKHQLEIIGLLYILIGFILQLIFYIL